MILLKAISIACALFWAYVMSMYLFSDYTPDQPVILSSMVISIIFFVIMPFAVREESK